MKEMSEKLYYIICKRHMKTKDGAILFWRPNNSGYTYNVEEAGLYTHEETSKSHSEDNRDDPRIGYDTIQDLISVCVIENSKLGHIVRNNKENRLILDIQLNELQDSESSWDKSQFVNIKEFIERYKRVSELYNEIMRGLLNERITDHSKSDSRDYSL